MKIKLIDAKPSHAELKHKVLEIILMPKKYLACMVNSVVDLPEMLVTKHSKESNMKSCSII